MATPPLPVRRSLGAGRLARRAATVLVVAGAAAPGAPPALADGPQRISVVGSGHVAATDFAVSIDAGPAGEGPRPAR